MGQKSVMFGDWCVAYDLTDVFCSRSADRVCPRSFSLASVCVWGICDRITDSRQTAAGSISLLLFLIAQQPNHGIVAYCRIFTIFCFFMYTQVVIFTAYFFPELSILLFVVIHGTCDATFRLFYVHCSTHLQLLLLFFITPLRQHIRSTIIHSR